MFPRVLDLITSFFLLTVLFTVGCSAQQTEEQALQSLREMTRGGKLPPEDFVAGIESRFAGKQTGALAKLLHARIRFENNDFVGAAAILNTDLIEKKTKVGDHALWLRGQALQRSGDHTQAAAVLAKLIHDYPDSVRARDAKLAWAVSAIQTGHAVEVPGFLVELSEKNDADALLATAKAYDAQPSQPEAIKYYRRTYFFAAGSAAAKEAEAKLTLLGQPLTPQSGEEQLGLADRRFNTKNFNDAATAYADLAANYPALVNPGNKASVDNRSGGHR